jgi:hypothetical protein
MMWVYFFPEEERDSQRRQVGLKFQISSVNLFPQPRFIVNILVVYTGSLEDLNHSWCKACKELFKQSVDKRV